MDKNHKCKFEEDEETNVKLDTQDDKQKKSNGAYQQHCGQQTTSDKRAPLPPSPPQVIPVPSKKRKKSSTDDCGQIDSIIGDFGKYQLMIFIFKILIGATSAFNNLGVTFFAPSDFISYWCADSPAVISPNANYQSNNMSGPTSYGIMPLPLGPSARLTATPLELSLPQLPPQPYAAAAATSSHHIKEHHSTNGQSIAQLMGDFVYNTERARRHQLASFTSDTPTKSSLRRECDYLSPEDNKRHKCTAFKYDTGIWMSTIIDEWDLVCDRSLFISITQSLYMAGFIVSYLLFGYLSDRFGRWNSLLLGAMIEIASGFGCAFAGSVCQFMIFRFLLGIGNAGRSSSSYLIMIEWTGQSWRMHISTLGSLGWAAGYCAMPWIVMHFLHFRHMQLFVCFYEFIFLMWLLFLPESPRWLLTHKRFIEAHEVLLKAAKFNGLIQREPSIRKTRADPTGNDVDSSTGSVSDELSSDGSIIKDQVNGIGPFARRRLSSVSGSPPVLAYGGAHCETRDNKKKATVIGTHLVSIGQPGEQVKLAHLKVNVNKIPVNQNYRSLEPYTLDEFEAKFAKLAETIALKEFTKNEDRLSILDLFKWHNLRGYFFILAFAWAINSFIYYGIVLNVGNFGGKNLFVSFTWAGATELPSIVFTMICMKILPRRTTNVFLFSTIFLLCALQVPLKYYELGWLQQSTMILAKLFNSCSFTVILYQTMELFPTSIRQTAYSSCSLAGRIGSIAAPFIKELSQMTNNLVPPVIYAVLSLAEVALIRHLPETKGSDLPDTLLEAEKFKGTDKSGGKQNEKSNKMPV